MQRHTFPFYLMLSILITVAIVFGIIYRRINKETSDKNGNIQQISVDNSLQKIKSNEPVQKVQIDADDRIVLTGMVEGLSLDANTEKYTLSMLITLPGLRQQQILVELGSPKYQHLVRYSTPKGEKKTIEEVRSMDSIAHALIQGNSVQIEISMNPDIEDFWKTYRDPNRNEVFKVVLPSVISIQI